MSMEDLTDDDFMSEMLSDFLDESGTYLEHLNESLLEIDDLIKQAGDDAEVQVDVGQLNAMFRDAHSLKGLSGMLGLDDINRLTHKIENVFDAARNDELSVSRNVVDLILESVDHLTEMIDQLSADDPQPLEYEHIVDALSDLLSNPSGADEDAHGEPEPFDLFEVAQVAETVDGTASEVVETHEPISNGQDRNATPQSTDASASVDTLADDADADVIEAEIAENSSADDLALDAEIVDPEDPAEAIREATAEAEVAEAEVAEAEVAEAEVAEAEVAEAEVAEAEVPEDSVDERTDLAVASVQGSDPAETSTAPVVEATVVEDDGASNAVADVFTGIEDCDSISEKYLAIFVDETEDTLSEMSELLEASAGLDLAKLLALGHRIKGSAASIGLNRAAKLAHLLEDLFQDLKDQDAQPDAAAVEAFVFTVDRMFDYVTALPQGGCSDDRFGEAYQLLASAQLTFRETETKADDDALVATTDVASVDMPSALQEFVATAAIPDSANRPCFCAVQFAHDLPLVGMKARLILDRMVDCGEVFAASPPLEAIEDIANLEILFFGLDSEDELASISARLRADGVRDVLVLEQKREDPGVEMNPPPNPSAPSTAPPTSEPKSADTPPKPKDAPAAESTSRSDRSIETIRVDIDRLDHLMNQAGQLVINKARFSRIGDQFKSLGVRKQFSNSLGNASMLLDKVEQCAEGMNANDRNKGSIGSMRSHIQELRIELQAVHNDLSQLSNLRGLVNDLGEAVHQLDRVAEGIQQSVMDTRMVPIGPLFSRFKRVVRDYTKGSGKDIRLVIRGDKTELDKRMIDELSDPLIHMVRNAADHGIETPEERRKTNKPNQGTITLDAFHRGNQVFVEVRDDGRGLDPERLKKKAVQKGLITAEDAERLTTHQAFQLIWEPGFSTAETITEISGRGMGMDIVHSKLENLNGTVDIDSHVGEGTTITVKLPLTMAILPSLLTVIGDEVFAIPVESVLEIVQVSASQFSTVHGAKTALIRGRVVSVIELRDLWNSKPTDGSSLAKEETLVIIGEKGNELGLVVNGLLGEEAIVIKSLAENYRNVTGFAGASILGDGRVSLILDANAIIDMACNRDGYSTHITTHDSKTDSAPACAT